MAETKPYRTDRWHWHTIRDRYDFRSSDWNKKHRVTLFTFFKYFCGPRYNFMQILKILSLLLLSGTCIFNLQLIIETNNKLENHKLVLDFDDSNVVPFNEEEYFSRLKLKEFVVEQNPNKFNIKVISSKDFVDVIVNGESVHRDDDADIGRGIHVVVLHQTTGSVMSQRVFDTYTPKQDEALVQFLDSITSNRIFVFAIKDEASFQLHDSTRQRLKQLGSELINHLEWRNTWAMICSNTGTKYAEDLKTSNDHTSWAAQVVINAEVDSTTSQESSCNWSNTPENHRREAFCSRFDGYGDLCRCDEPSPLTFDPGEPLKASSVPIAVIASNRPQYLYRMLRSLLSARGANPSMVVVFIDGHFEEPYKVSRLFDLKTYQHVPVGVKNARISQHYKSSLGATFTLFPDAEEIIIVEEDLDVAPDFFSYFSQTMYLLKEDSSIYCISAWNDQGYQHSSNDPSLLYRVETMPGLGWMLKRSLFEEELEPHWPSQEKRWDWDMWMRMDIIRKDRECIIPDVPRTYHFGSMGINMNSYFFDMYFDKHALNNKPNVKLKDVDLLKKSSYERVMHTLIRDARVLDHSKTPCDFDFITNNLSQNDTFVAYFRMDNEDATDVFLEISKCLKIWDLDVRGLHRGAFRTFMKRRHIIFVGYPASPYSLYKPTELKPIFIEHSKKDESVGT